MNTDIEKQMLFYNEHMPSGKEYFDWICSKDKQKEETTIEIFESDSEFNSIDTYKAITEFLKVAYKVSTCGYGCRGGSHIIEFITGRGYNLGIASLKLLRLGFYDESLSLIRSISEIVNLFALFGVNENALNEWYHLTEKERLKEFSPSKVRLKLSATALHLPITKEYYSKLCEIGVHVNPTTTPQGKNAYSRAMIGGIVLKEQAIATLNDLAFNLGWLALTALRNAVDKKVFIKEIETLKPNYSLIGDLNIETIDNYLSKNKNQNNV